MRTHKVLPDFVLLGAQRAGTTSMHSYLKQHPDIFMSQPLKEPGFFLDKDFMRNMHARHRIFFKSKNSLLKNFMLQGYKGEKLFGESTTYYTWGERSRKQKVPERIKQTNRKMKFIYIIRNPLDRMISSFLGFLVAQKNLQYLKLNEFVNENSWVLSNSLYFYQLKPYFETFQEKQFKIIIFEEYISNPAKTLNEIFTHLSLEKINDFEPFKILNRSENKYSLPENELKFTEENYRKLIGPIKKDIAKMEIVLNKSLDFWDISKEKWCLSQEFSIKDIFYKQERNSL